MTRRKSFLKILPAAILILCMALGILLYILPPAEVRAAENSADEQTLNSYEEHLGGNASTRYAGRVWADKTVSTEDISFEGGDAGTFTVKNDSDFLVAYSALASSRAFMSRQPADVVFILDFSGSMTWGADSAAVSEPDGSDSRIRYMVDALNSSIGTLVKANASTRIAIVTFSGSSETLLPLTEASEFLKVKDGNYLELTGFEGTTGADDAEAEVTCHVSGGGVSRTAGGTNIQAGLYEGMKILASEEETVFRDGSARVTRIPNVILMSDGAPTTHASSLEGLHYQGEDGWSGEPIGRDTRVESNPLDGGAWWKGVSDRQIGGGDNSMPYSANGFMALLTASYMKNAITDNYYGDSGQEANVYTIGFSTELQTHAMAEMAAVVLNPAEHLGEDSSITREQAETDHPDSRDALEEARAGRNQLNRAWEEYRSGRRPSVDAKYGSSGDRREILVEIAGDGYNPESLAYPTRYFTAENAGELNSAFSRIAGMITAEAEAPTEVDGDPSHDGYITYTDPLGEYMEVKDVKAVLYGGRAFTAKSVSEQDGAVAYSFQGEIDSPVYGGHPLSEIEITVRQEETRQVLTVRIPASAIPIRVNTLMMDSAGAVTENRISPAYPVRVLYTVGLSDGAVDEHGRVTGQVSEEYRRENLDSGGQIRFYSNLFTGETQDGVTVGNASVEFTPSKSNPFYFVTEDTPLYLDEACAEPAAELREDGVYYLPDGYYEGNSRVDSSLRRTGDLLKNYTEVRDGVLYLKAGSPRLGNLLDYVEETKGSNLTGTAEAAWYPTFQGTPEEGKFVVYLGNNGVTTADPPASLVIGKQAEADPGFTVPETDFSFEVTLEGQEGSTLQAVLNGGEGTEMRELKFDRTGTASFSLRAGETLEIPDLRRGTDYRIREKDLPEGFALSGTDGPAEGTLESGENTVTFTNTYRAVFDSAGAVNLTGVKELEGQSLEEGEFHFSLKPLDGAPMGESRELNPVSAGDDGDGDGIWTGEISLLKQVVYQQPGTYFYLVSEQIPDQQRTGMTYDETVYRVSVEVTDDGRGHLTASAPVLERGSLDDDGGFVKEGDADRPVFTNRYAPLETEAGLPSVTKVLEGGRAEPLGEGEFTFELSLAGADPADGAVMPERTLETSRADGSVEFQKVRFTKPGIYVLEIREQIPEEGQRARGITYSRNVFQSAFRVTDRDGQLEAVRISSSGSRNFVNTWTPDPVSVALTAAKKMEGRELRPEDRFTFTLEAAEGSPENTPLPADPTAVNSADGSIVFAPVTFTEAGLYRYNVRETGGSAAGVTGSTTLLTALVEVVCDTDSGALRAQVSWEDDNSTFVNVYRAEPTDPVAGFTAVKTVTAEDGNRFEMQGGEFSFRITPSGANPAGDPVEESVVHNDSSGTAVLAEQVCYGEPGTYVYTVKEEPGSAGGMIWDDSVYTVTVEVTDSGGKLLADAAVTRDGAPADQIVFENHYSPAAAGAVLGGRKILEGRDPEEGQFRFLLESDGTAPMPADGKTEAAGGETGIFRFGTIVYEAPGTYHYRIREADGGEPGYTYDGTVFDVQVTVTDQNGVLQADTAVNGNPDGEAVFVNRYLPAPAVLEGETAIGGTKTLEGRELRDGEFTFLLLDGSGAEVSRAVSGADGTFRFGPLTFDTEGVRFYSIREENSHQGGVTYDGRTWTVKITVEDRGGYLEASAEYLDGEGNSAEEASFVNSYRAEPAVLQLGAEKILTGRSLREGEFTFLLTDSLGQAVQETSNDGSGAVRFHPLQFEQAGVYTYTISESQESDPYVTYDSTVYPVTVTVTDNQEGQLEAEVKADSGEIPVFRNVYQEPAAPSGMPAAGGGNGAASDGWQGSAEHADNADTGDRTAPPVRAALAMGVAGLGIILLLAVRRKSKD